MKWKTRPALFRQYAPSAPTTSLKSMCSWIFPGCESFGFIWVSTHVSQHISVDPATTSFDAPLSTRKRPNFSGSGCPKFTWSFLSSFRFPSSKDKNLGPCLGTTFGAHPCSWLDGFPGRTSEGSDISKSPGALLASRHDSASTAAPLEISGNPGTEHSPGSYWFIELGTPEESRGTKDGSWGVLTSPKMDNEILAGPVDLICLSLGSLTHSSAGPVSRISPVARSTITVFLQGYLSPFESTPSIRWRSVPRQDTIRRTVKSGTNCWTNFNNTFPSPMRWPPTRPVSYPAIRKTSFQVGAFPNSEVSGCLLPTRRRFCNCKDSCASSGGSWSSKPNTSSSSKRGLSEPFLSNSGTTYRAKAVVYACA